MLGAIAALLAVILLGIVVHKPLTTIPENTLKFCVGILLAAFGTFWVGEGRWPELAGRGLVYSGLDRRILLAALLAQRVCRAAAQARFLPAS